MLQNISQRNMFTVGDVPVGLEMLDDNLHHFSTAIGQNFRNVADLVSVLDTYRMFDADLPKLMEMLANCPEVNLQEIVRQYLGLTQQEA